MMRLCCYVLGILLIASAPRALAQAQVDNQSEKKPSKAHVDSVYDPDQHLAVSSDWLKARADELKDVMSCYIQQATLDQVVAKQESESKGDPAVLIKMRIRSLKELAVNHVKAQYCG